MAGLIPQEFIDDLLDRSDVVDVIGSRIQLKKSGRNYTALCPFHQEKTPSFSVNQEKQFYYCFGCGAGGNSLQFMIDHDRIDFPQAVEQLARQQGLEVPQQTTNNNRSPQRAQQQTLYQLMEKIARFYQQQLNTPQGQHAAEYLQQRHISTSSIEQFELGYAPAGNNLLSKHFAQNTADKNNLIKAGMLALNEQQQSYERFRNRLMFPIRDKRGRIVAFGGRTLGNDRAKYLNSPETSIFHKSKELYGLYHLRQQRGEPEFILICEGYMDVIALHQHNIHNAVATLGTATNEQHLKTLFRFCPNLIFSFDGDEAGKRAAQRAFHVLLPQLQDGYRVKFLFLPQGEDPDSIVTTQGKTGFAHYIRNAQTFSDYFFELLIPAHANLDDLSLKALISKKAIPLIEQIPGPAYRQLLLQALQQRTGLDKNTLDDLYVAQQHTAKQQQSIPQQPSQPKQRALLKPTQKTLRLTPARRALSIILNHPQLIHELGDMTIPATDEDQQLLKQLIEHTRQHPGYSYHRLLGSWLNLPQENLLLRLLADGAALNLELNDCRQELQDCLSHLCKEPKFIDSDLIKNISAQPKNKRDELKLQLQQQFERLQEKHRQNKD